MKKSILHALFVLTAAAPLLLLLTKSAVAQDPSVVDSAHYKVELQNDDVRVLRIKYGPGEESVMHYHPESVVVALSDSKATFTLPDGSTQDIMLTAGQVLITPAGAHQPKNTGDGVLEVLQIELKEDAEMMEEDD